MNNHRINELEEQLKDYKKKFAIYGTGSVGEKYFKELSGLYGADSVEFFIDSMLKRDRFYDKEVIAPKDLINKELDNYTYIIGSLTSAISMRSELIKRGVKEEYIFKKKDFGEETFMEEVVQANNILIYPKLENKEQVDNILEKIYWYAPLAKDKAKLHILCDDQIVTKKNMNYKNVNFISDYKEMKFDLVLIWDKSFLNSSEIVKYKNIFCIDPNYFTKLDMKILTRLNMKLDEHENLAQYKELSRINYSNLVNKLSNKNAYVFGCGPSLKEGINRYKQIEKEDSIRIACNGCINSNEIMSEINPNIFVVFDDLYLSKPFGSDMYNIINYIKNNQCKLIVPLFWLPLLFNRYDGIENCIVGIDLDAKQINFPDVENLSVYRKAANIVTLLALPVASSLSNNIYITGCDGYIIEDNEVLQWSHLKEIEHEEGKLDNNLIIQSKYDGYMEYYLKHDKYFNEIIEHGEGLGKVYKSLTKSYMTALKNRYYEKC